MYNQAAKELKNPGQVSAIGKPPDGSWSGGYLETGTANGTSASGDGFSRKACFVQSTCTVRRPFSAAHLSNLCVT